MLAIIVLGSISVVGLLGGVSVTGFTMAVFIKKYIESGYHGGKGSACHKAAVVDDPFKDTSGSALNILIKLCSAVAIVFSGLIMTFYLVNLL